MNTTVYLEFFKNEVKKLTKRPKMKTKNQVISAVRKEALKYGFPNPISDDSGSENKYDDE